MNVGKRFLGRLLAHRHRDRRIRQNTSHQKLSLAITVTLQIAIVISKIAVMNYLFAIVITATLQIPIDTSLISVINALTQPLAIVTSHIVLSKIPIEHTCIHFCGSLFRICRQSRHVDYFPLCLFISNKIVSAWETVYCKLAYRTNVAVASNCNDHVSTKLLKLWNCFLLLKYWRSPSYSVMVTVSREKWLLKIGKFGIVGNYSYLRNYKDQLN